MTTCKKIFIPALIIAFTVIIQASFISASGCHIITAAAGQSWSPNNADGYARHDEASLPIYPYTSNRFIIRNLSADKLMVFTQPVDFRDIPEKHMFPSLPRQEDRAVFCGHTFILRI